MPASELCELVTQGRHLAGYVPGASDHKPSPTEDDHELLQLNCTRKLQHGKTHSPKIEF